MFIGFVLLVVSGIGALIQGASKSSPENVAKDAARFDQELRTAVGKQDRKRAEALLRQLPKWPPRDSLLAATASLMELRGGTAPAEAVDVSPHFLEKVNLRAAACEHAVCLVAVRMLAARLHSGQTRFRSLSDRSRAALLDDGS